MEQTAEPAKWICEQRKQNDLSLLLQTERNTPTESDTDRTEQNQRREADKSTDDDLKQQISNGSSVMTFL